MRTSHKKSKIVRFADVEQLQARIETETPKTGEYFYDYKLAQAKKEEGLINQQQFHLKYKINFSDLPISHQTLKGLTNRNFTKMTEIQRCTIPHALANRDIMAASRTGSGKTLAYLIPLVQKLYRKKFIPIDGLGAIVLVPVRQLAMQVFQVLNSFTAQTEISVGLIIGGKDVKFEQQRIKLMNILICTPGRLLQHLEETYGFETNNLQMLVLDEADVMLEMGFKETLNSILSNLPKCQTMFFSATLNKDVHQLAKLSLSDPQRVFLHSIKERSDPNQQNQKQSINNIYETPAKLMQYYMIVKPEDKLNTLYSFLKSHQKQKILIFTSTCKQVRFIYESFKKFRMGCPMYELQGHQKQKKRMAIYFTFCQKRYGILVCTNIAARGLDFPMIDWVVQFDLPDQPETYVHRVGRTARYKAEGKALSFVAEHQTGFMDELKSKNVNVHKIIQNPQKYFRIESSLQSICSEHQDVKYLAQRALISYLKFIYKVKNKKYFKLNAINLQNIAKSYGLQNAPQINIKVKQEEDSQNQDGEPQKQLTKIQKLRLKTKMKKAELKEQKLALKQKQKQEIEDEEEQLLTVKEVIRKNPNQKPILTTSKRQLKKVKDEGHFQGKNKVFFDENLNKVTADQYRKMKYLQNNKEQVNYDAVNEMEQRITQNKERDAQIEKERRKNKRRKINQQKQQRSKQMYSGSRGEQIAVLGSDSDQYQDEQ